VTVERGRGDDSGEDSEEDEYQADFNNSTVARSQTFRFRHFFP